MPSFLAGLSRAGRILVINRAVHNYFLLILEWISPATSGTEKTQLLNMSFIMIILVSQMCKKQNFHLSLLTMQQQQQYIVSKARYLSYFTGYWVKYNWLSCLFVCYIFRLRAGGGVAPSLNTRYKPGRKTPMHLSSDSEEDLSFTWCTSSIILDVGWKLWLGIIVGCLQVDFSDNVASQKKHMAAAKQWNLCKLGK